MSALAQMIRWDALLQWRSHLYAATAVATAFVCAVVLMIPLDPIPPKLVAALIFVDPAVIGLSFVGGVIAMERTAGTLSALGVSPSPGWVYVVSKIATFTFLGVLSGGVIAIVAAGAAFNAPMMLFALVLTNAAAVVIGFVLVAPTRSMNGFISSLIIFSMISILPIAAFFDLAPAPIDLLLRVIPSYAMLIVLEAGVSVSVATADLFYGVAYLLLIVGFGLKRAVGDYDQRIVTEGL